MLPATLFGAGLALLLASINVYLRDTQHLVEVIVGAAWFWACPIVYSFQSTIVPKFAEHGIPTWLFLLNPMTPLVMTFQRVLYNHMGKVTTTIPHPPGTPPVKLEFLPPWGPWHYVALDSIVLGLALVLVYVGMVVFGRLAGNFAEEL
jgi:ABC-2 type transport system permease protein